MIKYFMSIIYVYLINTKNTCIIPVRPHSKTLPQQCCRILPQNKKTSSPPWDIHNNTPHPITAPSLSLSLSLCISPDACVCCFPPSVVPCRGDPPVCVRPPGWLQHAGGEAERQHARGGGRGPAAVRHPAEPAGGGHRVRPGNARTHARTHARPHAHAHARARTRMPTRTHARAHTHAHTHARAHTH